MDNKLFEYRQKCGLKQGEVASVIGKTTSYYGMLEVGKRKPSIDVAYKLAKFYKVSIEEIFFDN